MVEVNDMERTPSPLNINFKETHLLGEGGGYGETDLEVLFSKIETSEFQLT